MIRLGYCLGVKSVVSIKETIMYQLEASKKNPKSSQSLQGRATNRFFVLSLDLPYHKPLGTMPGSCDEVLGLQKM